MRGSNLTLAIALLGVGSLLVWVGFSNPPGGLFGAITDAVNGVRHPSGSGAGGIDYATAGATAGSLVQGLGDAGATAAGAASSASSSTQGTSRAVPQ